jgi:hypothetical protein
VAGKIIADIIEAPYDKITLNVGNTTVLTANGTGITYVPTSNLNISLNASANIATGNIIASGVIIPNNGIRFPATQVASGDANTLDDYEEGTWIPVYTGSSGTATYSQQDGTYTKIGRIVHFTGKLQAGKNTLSGSIDITGLPFSGTEDGAGMYITFGRGFTGMTTSQELRGYVTGTQIELRLQHSSSSASVPLTPSEMDASTANNYIYFSGSYHTT